MERPRAEEVAGRAVRIARDAWRTTHRGLPNPPMTRSADVVAVAALAASMIARLDRSTCADDARLETEAADAIQTARAVAHQLAEPAPGNPMMRAAEKAAVGILAAGILNRRD